MILWILASLKVTCFSTACIVLVILVSYGRSYCHSAILLLQDLSKLIRFDHLQKSQGPKGPNVARLWHLPQNDLWVGFAKTSWTGQMLAVGICNRISHNVRLLLMQTIESNKFCCYHEAAFADAELPPLTKLFTSILINQLISVHLRVLGLDCLDVLVLQGFLRTLCWPWFYTCLFGQPGDARMLKLEAAKREKEASQDPTWFNLIHFDTTMYLYVFIYYICV